MSDKRTETSKLNGLKGGHPWEGKQLPTDELVDATATAILAGKRSPLSLPGGIELRKSDREIVAKLTGVAADEFVVRLASRLRTLADKTADRIEEKLDTDAFKPEGLSYLMGVVVDKLSAIEGRRATHDGNINVQVNNFHGPNGLSREKILAALGDPNGMGALEVETEEPDEPAQK